MLKNVGVKGREIKGYKTLVTVSIHMEAGDEEEGSKEVKVLAKFRPSFLNIKKPKITCFLRT